MSYDKESTYYDAGGIEVMSVQKAKLTPQQYEGFLLGNVIKYSLRCNHKGTKAKDIHKLHIYSKLLEEHINEDNIK